MSSLHILMLAPHPHIRTPLSKHTPLLADGLRELGCTVRVEAWGRHREHESFWAKVAGRAADVARVRRVLRTAPFDILLVKTAHDWKTVSRDVVLLLATRGLCRRRVVQFHGSWMHRLVAPGDRIFKAVSALLARLCDAVLVLSREEQRQWRACYPWARVDVVKNPLAAAPAGPTPARRNLDLPDGLPILLFVGRLIREKGIHDLLIALSMLCTRTPCHLLLAGEGIPAADLQRQAATLGIARHVTFAGYLEGDALRAAYAAADIFVLPSRSESFPHSVLEAMQAGLPVVTSRIRGVVDHLQEAVHGLFTTPCDVTELTSALQTLLDDPALRRRMGDNNREKVKDFAPAVVSREFLAVLTEIATR